MENKQEFDYCTEQFDDIRILRYQVPAFAALTPRERIFVYYLSQAALAGRDILWDQNNRYNLRLRQVFERILRNYPDDRTAEYRSFVLYVKKVFFANGIHHHYSMDKFSPRFSKAYFRHLLAAVGLEEDKELERLLFDPEFQAKRVVLDEGKDLVEASANNYYRGVSQQEAQEFYRAYPVCADRPVSRGLNSTLVKENGRIYEEVWKVGGKYSTEIERIVYWLEKALPYACHSRQQEVIRLLVRFYQTGDLGVFDEYSIAWVRETEAPVDFINGFIEVYGDPLAYKGSWESVVEIVDRKACERTRRLAACAWWFEQHAPIAGQFKKTEVEGVTARVMQVAMLGGDCHPATPIGINLPNAEWIREKYGSKSVTLDNITYAYDMDSRTSGVTDEFAFSEEERALAREWGALGSKVHTDLHECLGHGSGKMMPGVTTEALGSYYSTLEEARADLFALYYIMDPKLVELAVLPGPAVARAEYNSYIRNGLMVQLTRLKPGEQLEEAHMRNRQLIAAWVYEQGKAERVIEKTEKEGKTYFVIRDYEKLRLLFGKLLAEVQRIKSEGDYGAARQLVETYGVRVDAALHREVLQRYGKLGVAPYAGFINPVYQPVIRNGEIEDVSIVYPTDFLQQMLEYGTPLE